MGRWLGLIGGCMVIAWALAASFAMWDELERPAPGPTSHTYQAYLYLPFRAAKECFPEGPFGGPFLPTTETLDILIGLARGAYDVIAFESMMEVDGSTDGQIVCSWRIILYSA